MSNVLVLVGAGVISLVLFLLYMKAGDKDRPHPFLQVLLLGFILVCFVFVGKAALDDSDKNCDWLLNSSFEHYQYINESGGTPAADPINILHNVTTTNTYDYYCEATGTTSGQDFFKFTVSIMGVVGIYLICYLLYAVLVYFGWVIPGNKEGRGNEGGGI